MPALACPGLPAQLRGEAGLASDQEHGGADEEADGVVGEVGEQPTDILGNKLKYFLRR